MIKQRQAKPHSAQDALLVALASRQDFQQGEMVCSAISAFPERIWGLAEQLRRTEPGVTHSQHSGKSQALGEEAFLADMMRASLCKVLRFVSKALLTS